MEGRNKIGSILWGVVFILVGLGVAGNAFHLWDFKLFFNGWWTLFIIVPCSISVIQNGPKSGSIIGLIIGILLLLMQQEIVEWSTVGDLIIPIILVVIGLGFILKSNNRKCDHMFENDGSYCGYQNSTSETYTSSTDTTGSTAGSAFDQSSTQSTGSDYAKAKEISAVFGSRKVTYQNEVFTGATMNAIFGGACLDIRNASMSGNIEITATAVFGGVDILVPENVRVVANSVPIFGGVTNKAMNPIGDIKAVIHINATCMFGGIDIK